MEQKIACTKKKLLVLNIIKLERVQKSHISKHKEQKKAPSNAVYILNSVVWELSFHHFLSHMVPWDSSSGHLVQVLC